MTMFSSFWMANAGGSTAYAVDNSAMFDDASDQYLKKVYSTTGTSNKTITLSTWFKRGKLGANSQGYSQNLIGFQTGAQFLIEITTADQIRLLAENNAGGVSIDWTSDLVLRDPHAWYHIVWTLSTLGDPVNKVWLNGVEVTGWTKTTNSLAQDDAFPFGSTTSSLGIATRASYSVQDFDGYLSETVYMDGAVQTDATNFGEYATNAIWRPKDLTDTFALSSTAEAIANVASATTNSQLTTYTYSSVALGTASETRAVYVFVTAQEPGTAPPDVSSLTVGGVSATRVSDVSNSVEPQYYVSELWRADVPSGTTGDIVVTWNTPQSRCGVIAWAVTGDHNLFDLQTSSNTSASFTLTGVPDGSVILAGRGGTGGERVTWGSDVTENIDEDIEPGGVCHSGASSTKSTGGNFTVTCARTDGTTDTRARTVALVLSPKQGATGNSFYLPFTDSSNLGGDYQTGGVTSITLSGEWNGDTGDFGTLDTDIIATGGNQGAIRTNDTFTSDFAFDFVWKGGSNPAYVGVYEIDEDGTFSTGSSDGGMGSMTDSFYIYFHDGSNNVNAVKGSSTEASNIFTAASGEVIKFQRSGSQFKVFEDGALRHTFTGTSSNEVRILVGQSSSSLDWENFRWVTGGTTLGNPLTPVNSPTQTSDSPTKNYVTLSPLSQQSGNYFNGNTKVTAGADQGLNFASFPVTTGQKVYIEATCSGATSAMTGCVKSTAVTTRDPSSDFDGLAVGDGRLLHVGLGDVFNSDTSAHGAAGLSAENYAPNDSVPVTHMIALDLINDKIYWGDAGVGANGWSNGSGSFNQSFDNAVGVDLEANLDWFFTFRPFSATIEVNFGATAFTVSPPTGYISGYSVALENENRQTALAIENGSDFFQATTYTGVNGANSVEQSGASSMRTGTATFQPDMAWIKRTDGVGPPGIFDAVRTSGEYLLSSEENAEASESSFSGFDANGFNFSAADTALESNTAGRSYVGWQWLGANSTATPSGSSGISSLLVSANTTSGFSIGKFTAQSSGTGVVAHGLGGVGDLIFLKPLATSSEGNSWTVWHSGVNSTSGNTTRMNLNTTTINSTGAARVNAVASDTFTINDDAYFHGRNFVFYAWRAIPGYSKFGTFEGNGTTGTTGNGPFIELGFRPALVALKNADVATNGHWVVMDSSRNTFNVANGTMWWSLANGQDTGEAQMDFVSNGVKIKGGTSARYNADNETFIYMAWAENPFAGTTPVTAR